MSEIKTVEEILEENCSITVIDGKPMISIECAASTIRVFTRDKCKEQRVACGDQIDVGDDELADIIYETPLVI